MNSIASEYTLNSKISIEDALKKYYGSHYNNHDYEIYLRQKKHGDYCIFREDKNGNMTGEGIQLVTCGATRHKGNLKIVLE